MTFNYFEVLALAWAALAIGSRVLMASLGRRWVAWETERAYPARRPWWVIPLGVFALLLIIYTWYQVVATDVRYSWILALLVSLTAVKVYSLVFHYPKFRAFVVSTLNNRAKMTGLNLGVLAVAAVLILLAAFVY